MTDTDHDVIDEPWCCLTCSERFRFGELVTAPGANRFGVGCPVRKSGDISRANGEINQLDAYQGEIGTLQ